MILFITLITLLIILLIIGSDNPLLGLGIYFTLYISYIVYTIHTVEEYEKRVYIQDTMRTDPETLHKYHRMVNSN